MKNTTKYKAKDKKKVVVIIIASWFIIGLVSLSVGENHESIIESEIAYASPNNAIPKNIEPIIIEKEIIETPVDTSIEDSILKLYKEKEAKKNAIMIYLQENRASEDLIDLVPLLVELSYLHDIDPFRPISIIIHETEFGKSKAFIENKNVAGINWTSEQKRKIGIRSNIYNLAVEKTHEASVTNLIMLLVTYKNFKTPLVTLSQIQTKYAPSDDARNGLSGMNNNTWTKNTIIHYRGIEGVYNESIK